MQEPGFEANRRRRYKTCNFALKRDFLDFLQAQLIQKTLEPIPTPL